MTRESRRIAFVFVLLLALIAALTWWQLQRDASQHTQAMRLPPAPVLPEPAVHVAPAPSSTAALPPRETTPAPPVVTAPLPPLDLHLPPSQAAPDKPTQVPDRRVTLPDLFAEPTSLPDVAIGGRLIIRDDPAQKETPLRERVKGAEVQVQIKTE